MLKLISISTLSALIFTLPKAKANPYPRQRPKTMELMRRYLFLHRLKNKTLSKTSAAIERFSHEPKEPSSIALYPPPQETIPTLIRLNPMSSTTIPDTSGVIILRRYLKVRLTTISMGTEYKGKSAYQSGSYNGPDKRETSALNTK